MTSSTGASGSWLQRIGWSILRLTIIIPLTLSGFFYFMQ